jgi:hypothetical protein
MSSKKVLRVDFALLNLRQFYVTRDRLTRISRALVPIADSIPPVVFRKCDLAEIVICRSVSRTIINRSTKKGAGAGIVAGLVLCDALLSEDFRRKIGYSRVVGIIRQGLFDLVVSLIEPALHIEVMRPVLMGGSAAAKERDG